MKLSLGAFTSLKKPNEHPSAAQSPRDRLSAEIEHYIRYPVIDGDEKSSFYIDKITHKTHCLFCQNNLIDQKSQLFGLFCDGSRFRFFYETA